MTSELQPLRLTSSSQFSVRLGTTDGEVPIEVVIERKAIDNYFHLRATSPARRKLLVEAKLPAITRIVEKRHARREWVEGQRYGVRYRQIVIHDFRGETLDLPGAEE
jgi:hypothetical protein